MKKVVAVNERGMRIGESHQNAKLSDRDVDHIRELHEDHGFSYGYILDWWEISKSAISFICRYERRAQTPDRFKPLSARTKRNRL